MTEKDMAFGNNPPIIARQVNTRIRSSDASHAPLAAQLVTLLISALRARRTSHMSKGTTSAIVIPTAKRVHMFSIYLQMIEVLPEK